MQGRATGTFTLAFHPEPPYDTAGGVTLGKVRIDKQFQGDLEGSSRVEMISAVTATKGSAGYVAIEKVSATLAGRPGSFVLQHSGRMKRGEPSLSITVVADSGTDGLVGLLGTMSIDEKDGQHFYTFDYALPAG